MYASKNIQGRVCDFTDSECLSGVKVTLLDKTNNYKNTTYTDLDGNYNFNVENNLKYTIIVEYISYREVVFNTDNIINEHLNIKMKKL